MNQNYDQKPAAIGCAVLAGIIGLVAIVIGLLFGLPALGRYQSVQNAENQVTLNNIAIHQQEQLIQVERQKADIRVVEAQGIARSQEIINATLTDKYLQHEAIQAQEKMAGSPNHTTIYIPSGQNGIPIVRTADTDER